MPQCRCLSWCLSGYPKNLFCASGPGTLPPWLMNKGQCAAMIYTPNGPPREPQKSQKKKCANPTDARPELPHLAKYDSYPQGSKEHSIAQLIYLQNADGSWDMNEDLAKILGTSLEDMTAAHPSEVLEAKAWATMLAVIWLHANGKDLKDEWELLERKAVVWLHNNAVRGFKKLMRTANKFLKTSLSPSIFKL
ncbi:von Willebrand factor A domain-containing protein 5A-like [Arvicanthis niloticus]|uniref:von Willebrand factor A domain-containing protein 5A-like n=1 Tax=Arvicanthis niloticus TaxID=61156 RepID=UPI00402BD89F